jgi:hypothetical protein
MGFAVGDIINHAEMSLEEGMSLQKGMNFNTPTGFPIILMSTRPGATYKDRVEDEGTTLIYEGHNQPSNLSESPQSDDQKLRLPSGKFTENGKFFEAASKYKAGDAEAILVKVYEKLRAGVWVYNGLFKLIDAFEERTGRTVFKFKLLATELKTENARAIPQISVGRMIPSVVKQEVFVRDGGKCVECGETNNLHFDHIVPFSKGGSSTTAKNIQLLCARHNLSKSDKIL